MKRKESSEASRLLDWVSGMAEAMGEGGKSKAAVKLGISPSGFSHMLHVPNRSFDQKTLNAVAWIHQSRNETDQPAILEKKEIGDYMFELREGGEWTWRRKE